MLDIFDDFICTAKDCPFSDCSVLPCCICDFCVSVEQLSLDT